ncbi:MAG TPA: MmgE/PrpD family protein [Solirubrobacteraceae bacterium]|nr:MmgE/PrpD family protein [Solirubrobacteraceae bacterium]
MSDLASEHQPDRSTYACRAVGRIGPGLEARTRVEQLAEFVTASRFEDISEPAREQLKLRVLDSLGCALGALDGEPPRMVREQVLEFGGAPLATLIGGGKSAPDRAALYNGALVRYLDFNDSFLAPGETCHPSDNLAPVLAAAEYAHADGRTLLVALAVAYQVQSRLSEVAPVRAKGFDHTVQGAYAVAAGVARALGLDARRTTNAIAIAGTSLNALRVTRTGALSQWKGLAYPATSFGATHAAFLAMRGITGPREVFEGNKGFYEAIAGRFELDWAAEDLESVRRTILKKFNAEIHSQSAIEALLELRSEHRLTADEVERIELDTFQVAYDIIGGGEEGSKYEVRTKEEADHSLPYLLAVALLDGQVLPEQYLAERIAAPDVQELLRRVDVRPDAELSKRFPDEHSARVRLHLRDGHVLEREQHDYEGFHARPMGWDAVTAKFDRLAGHRLDAGMRTQVVQAARRLDELAIDELGPLLMTPRPSDERSDR